MKHNAYKSPCLVATVTIPPENSQTEPLSVQCINKSYRTCKDIVARNHVHPIVASTHLVIFFVNFIGA